MADQFTKKKRSEIMSRIRSKNTSLEQVVFRYLRKEGVYFQRHYKKAYGNPDIALPRKKRAVFIDGDFWHGWSYNRRKRKLPRVYWQQKIEGNIRRDKRNRALLGKNGWKVMRVWEHEINKKPTKILQKVKDFLTKI